MLRVSLFVIVVTLFIPGTKDIAGPVDGRNERSAYRSYPGRSIVACSPMASYVPINFLMTPIDLQSGIGSVDFHINT